MSSISEPIRRVTSAVDATPSWEARAIALRSRLTGVARRVTRSVDDAENAVDEAIARLVATRSAPRVPEHVDGWLYRTVLRIAIDQARAAARRGPTVGLAVEPAAPDDPAHAAERNELRDAVWRELVRLPRKQQAALVLHDLDGRDYAEVARLLDIREKTARAHVFAAREKLRRRLRPVWRGVTDEVS